MQATSTSQPMSLTTWLMAAPSAAGSESERNES